ncbi:hypothetical protein Tco_1288503 [Tanacetum coccineum]
MKDTSVASESSGTPSALEKSPLDFTNEDPPQIMTETSKMKVKPGVSCHRKSHLQDMQRSRRSFRRAVIEIPTEHVATTEVNVQFFMGSLESGKSTSIPSVVRLSGGIYQPGWGITNDCCLDTPNTCQDMVDHIVPPRYFSELRHLPNAEFLSQHNINLARKVAMGFQLRLRFEQETLLEAEVDIKKAAEAKNVELAKELDNIRVQFLGLQVSNDQLSQQVSNLQARVTDEERIKAAFEEFKKYKDDKVETRCAEMDARLDALSIDFDEGLYPYILTVIAGRRWFIGHGMREGLKYGLEHGKAMLDLAAIEAYNPEAETKYVVALHALKDFKYPLIDQLDKLRDILVYPEVRDPKDVWAFKEEILLEDDIAANRSHAKNKKKYQVVYRTHGVGSAYHARSDGILVSVPTVAPQGLAILLAGTTTQTEVSEDEASPRLFTSKSLPSMYNLDWP